MEQQTWCPVDVRVGKDLQERIKQRDSAEKGRQGVGKTGTPPLTEGGGHAVSTRARGRMDSGQFRLRGPSLALEVPKRRLIVESLEKALGVVMPSGKVGSRAEDIHDVSRPIPALPADT